MGIHERGQYPRDYFYDPITDKVSRRVDPVQSAAAALTRASVAAGEAICPADDVTDADRPRPEREEPEWMSVLDPERQAYLRQLDPELGGTWRRWGGVSAQNELLMQLIREVRLLSAAHPREVTR